MMEQKLVSRGSVSDYDCIDNAAWTLSSDGGAWQPKTPPLLWAGRYLCVRTGVCVWMCVWRESNDCADDCIRQWRVNFCDSSCISRAPQAGWPASPLYNTRCTGDIKAKEWPHREMASKRSNRSDHKNKTGWCSLAWNYKRNDNGNLWVKPKRNFDKTFDCTLNQQCIS